MENNLINKIDNIDNKIDNIDYKLEKLENKLNVIQNLIINNFKYNNKYKNYESLDNIINIDNYINNDNDNDNIVLNNDFKNINENVIVDIDDTIYKSIPLIKRMNAFNLSESN